MEYLSCTTLGVWRERFQIVFYDIINTYGGTYRILTTVDPPRYVGNQRPHRNFNKKIPLARILFQTDRWDLTDPD